MTPIRCSFRFTGRNHPRSRAGRVPQRIPKQASRSGRRPAGRKGGPAPWQPLAGQHHPQIGGPQCPPPSALRHPLSVQAAGSLVPVEPAAPQTPPVTSVAGSHPPLSPTKGPRRPSAEPWPRLVVPLSAGRGNSYPSHSSLLAWGMILFCSFCR